MLRAMSQFIYNRRFKVYIVYFAGCMAKCIRVTQTGIVVRHYIKQNPRFVSKDLIILSVIFFKERFNESFT
jgi:hypothetical protein